MTESLKYLWHKFSCGCNDFVVKHKNLKEHGKDTIYIECLKCNYETKGWNLGPEMARRIIGLSGNDFDDNIFI